MPDPNQRDAKLIQYLSEAYGKERELETALQVDIAITMDRPDTGDIRFKKLTSYVLGIYGGPSYFEGRPRPSSVADLSDHRWCGYIMDLLFTTELDLLN